MAEPFRRGRTGQVREALDRLERLVVDGLKRGFFDYSIACGRRVVARRKACRGQ